MDTRPVRQPVGPTRVGNTGTTTAASSATRSLSGGTQWWTEEEARLYESWAAIYDDVNKYNNPYFDYYFTGQDVAISIEGLTDPRDELDIYAFGYVIQQQKQPVYGFWSYTYDGMLRGTRIITGAFSLVVTEPHGLARKIATASSIRARAASNVRGALYPIRVLDDDEENIARYWSKNIDSNLEYNQQHVFSIHPPFNLLIRYGLQTTSLSSTSPDFRSEDIRQMYRGEAPIHSDYNERLVPNITPEMDHRVLLENVELTSKSLEYNVDGDPILETYSFIARDERIVRPKDYSRIAPNDFTRVPNGVHYS